MGFFIFMAEEKKSVVVYVDWGTTFDSLEDEEAGKLIKHFFNYVRDLNPTPPDKLTQIAFEPIKQQLKRDLQSWLIIKEKRSLAGKASANKREQASTNPTHVESVKQTSTNPTVTVNVNDSVTVNVNEEKAAAADLHFKKVCEMFKRVTTWDDKVLKIEVGKFLNKYQDTNIQNLGALINIWASNYEPQAIPKSERHWSTNI